MDRIERIKNDSRYAEYLFLNGMREADRVFCRHDYQHMLAVSKISYNIISSGGLEEFAKSQGLAAPDKAGEIIIAAGLLHDIGRWRQYDTGEDHALAGAVMAGEVLEKAGFLKKEIKTITRAIREHRRPGPGASYLGRVICLADDLSRPCSTCAARMECYKYEYMENIKERNKAGYCLDVG